MTAQDEEMFEMYEEAAELLDKIRSRDITQAEYSHFVDLAHDEGLNDWMRKNFPSLFNI